jgi:hypothetical protein
LKERGKGKVIKTNTTKKSGISSSRAPLPPEMG